MIIIKEYIEIEKTYVSEEVSKVTCDKCGKYIDLKGRIERYFQINFQSKNTPITLEDCNFQLCNDCTRELYNWFNYNKEEEHLYELDKDDDFYEGYFIKGDF